MDESGDVSLFLGCCWGLNDLVGIAIIELKAEVRPPLEGLHYDAELDRVYWREIYCDTRTVAASASIINSRQGAVCHAIQGILNLELLEIVAVITIKNLY